MENGVGAAVSGQTVTVTAANTYTGKVQAEIEGKKTWELSGHTVAPVSYTHLDVYKRQW